MKWKGLPQSSHIQTELSQEDNRKAEEIYHEWKKRDSQSKREADALRNIERDRKRKSEKVWTEKVRKEWEQHYNKKVPWNEWYSRKWIERKLNIQKLEKVKSLQQYRKTLEDLSRIEKDWPLPTGNENKLRPHAWGFPIKPFPPKGPERVEQDILYNPFDVEANGFTDLTGEAHLFKTNLNRTKELIREAGREEFFKSIFAPK